MQSQRQNPRSTRDADEAETEPSQNENERSRSSASRQRKVDDVQRHRHRDRQRERDRDRERERERDAYTYERGQAGASSSRVQTRRTRREPTVDDDDADGATDDTRSRRRDDDGDGESETSRSSSTRPSRAPSAASASACASVSSSRGLGLGMGMGMSSGMSSGALGRDRDRDKLSVLLSLDRDRHRDRHRHAPNIKKIIKKAKEEEEEAEAAAAAIEAEREKEREKERAKWREKERQRIAAAAAASLAASVSAAASPPSAKSANSFDTVGAGRPRQGSRATDSPSARAKKRGDQTQRKEEKKGDADGDEDEDEDDDDDDDDDHDSDEAADEVDEAGMGSLPLDPLSSPSFISPPIGSSLNLSRSGSFSHPTPLSVETMASDEWAHATRARVTSIAAAQRALDVEGLRRLLRRIPKLFLNKESFNPFNHWNDPQEELEEWTNIVQEAVQKIVDAYHKGFNTATSSFSHVLRNFSDSQRLVRGLHDHLVESKRLLQGRNAAIKDLYAQARQTAKMKEIMQKMMFVIEMPAWIDRFMERKQYVHAVVLLQHTLSLLVSPDLVDVDGLLEVRDELLLRKHAMQQILMQEMITCVYGKDIDEPTQTSKLHPFQQTKQTNDYHSRNASSTFSSGRGGNNAALGLLSHRSDAASSSSHKKPTPFDSIYSPFYHSHSIDDGQGNNNTAESSSSSASSTGVAADSGYDAAVHRALQMESRSAYVARPRANTRTFLTLLVEALSALNQLPSVKSQLHRRLRPELMSIIARETAICEESAKLTLAPRRLTQNAYAANGQTMQAVQQLVWLCQRIFTLIKRVLKNHLDVIQLIDSRLNGGAEQGNGMDASSSASSSSATTPAITAASRPFDESKLSMSGVWQIVQIVVQTTLTDYLHGVDERNQRNGGASTASAMAARSLSQTSKQRRNTKTHATDVTGDFAFSFDESSVPSVAKMSRGEKVALTSHRAESSASMGVGVGESSSAPWIPPTPYNITAIYRPVINFIQHAQKLLNRTTIATSPSPSPAHSLSPSDRSVPAGVGSSTHSQTVSESMSSAMNHSSSSSFSSSDLDSHDLRTFLNIFIEVSFLPRVESDISHRLDDVLSDPAAFDARELHKDARHAWQQHMAEMRMESRTGQLMEWRRKKRRGYDTDEDEEDDDDGMDLVSSAIVPLSTFPNSSLEHNLLFKCVLEVSDVLRRTFQDMFLLPPARFDYLRIISATVQRLVDKCTSKYINDVQREATPMDSGEGVEDGAYPNVPVHGQHTAGAPASDVRTAQQRLLSGDADLIALLEDDPFFKRLCMGRESAAQLNVDVWEDDVAHYFSPLNPIYAPIFNHSLRLDRNHLICDTRVWSHLSLMAESMEWMADRIFYMDVFSPEKMKELSGFTQGYEQHTTSTAHTKRSRLLSPLTGQHLDFPPFRRVLHSTQSHHGSGFSRFLSSLSPLDSRRWSLARLCLQLADRCLFTLRTDLHSHYYCFVRQMRSSVYWAANDNNEPDAWVNELIRHIANFDEAISKYMDTKKKSYVFGGSFEYLSQLLVVSLSHLQDKRVNGVGVAKLCRDCFALQQTLTNIDATSMHTPSPAMHDDASVTAFVGTDSGRQEGHFDRARQYFSLLNFSREELHLFQLENPDLFSADEYNALRSIQTQAHPAEKTKLAMDASAFA